MQASAAGMMTSDSKSGERYSTSAAKRAPASGARKMAATPAPMPAAISTRRSAGRRRSRPPRKEPKPAPTWAMGPSRPQPAAAQLPELREPAQRVGRGRRVRAGLFHVYVLEAAEHLEK